MNRQLLSELIGFVLVLVILGFIPWVLYGHPTSAAPVPPPESNTRSATLYFCSGTDVNGRKIRTNTWSYEELYEELSKMPGVKCEIRGTIQPR